MIGISFPVRCWTAGWHWQRAMWQAYQNLQVASHSYIAIWHEFAERPTSELESLAQHGLGLIVVGPRSARIALHAKDPTYRIARTSKRAFYAAVANGLHKRVGLRREDVVIGLVEVNKENWSFGNGEAQYVR